MGEDSLSHHIDTSIGVYIIDRYTYHALEFLEGVTRDSKKTMGEFLSVCPKRLCISTVGKRTDLFSRDPSRVPITDFFGSVRSIELTRQIENLTLSSQDTADTSKDGVCTKENSCNVKYHYIESLPIFKELDETV